MSKSELDSWKWIVDWNWTVDCKWIADWKWTVENTYPGSVKLSDQLKKISTTYY